MLLSLCEASNGGGGGVVRFKIKNQFLLYENNGIWGKLIYSGIITILI